MTKNLIRVNYFDPMVEGEETPLHISSDENKKYIELEKLYRRFYNEKTTEEGKTISQYERNLKKIDNREYTYGEIPFRTMAYIFEYCYTVFSIESQGNFVDMGSGNGNVVFCAVLSQLFRAYIGIEFIEILHKRALLKYFDFCDNFNEIMEEYGKILPDYSLDDVNINSLKQKTLQKNQRQSLYSIQSIQKEEDEKEEKQIKTKDKINFDNKETEKEENTNKKVKKSHRTKTEYSPRSMNDLPHPKLSKPVSEYSESINEEIEEETIKIPHIELIRGDFMERNLEEATFILINSSCFSSMLMSAISEKIQKEVKPGTIVVTISKRLPLIEKKLWLTKPGFKRMMSWGLGTIFVYKRAFDSANVSNSGTYFSQSKKKTEFSGTGEESEES